MPTPLPTVADLHASNIARPLNQGLAAGITDALSANGYLTTVALAAHFRVSRDRIVGRPRPYRGRWDQAPSHPWSRGRRRDRRHCRCGTAEARSLRSPRPSCRYLAGEPRRGAPPASIAGMPVRAVPGRPALLAKRMHVRRGDASLEAVTARLAELGVRPASEGCAR